MVNIVGPICESGDFLANDQSLPEVGPNDVIAIMGAGAYGFAMSSNYNSRPRAPEVMVDGGRIGIVRERESVAQLWNGETAQPRWLT